jgi:hypothetical protein
MTDFKKIIGTSKEPRVDVRYDNVTLIPLVLQLGAKAD